MLQHSEEYFNQFEFADVVADREFDPETEANPFLHITLHAVIEKQLKDRDPIEAFQFYNAMIKNKCTRHEALHLLMTILLKFLFPMLKTQRTLPPNRYPELLKNTSLENQIRLLDFWKKNPIRYLKKTRKLPRFLTRCIRPWKTKHSNPSTRLKPLQTLGQKRKMRPRP